MILSYHPCFLGDRNLLCAGREPDAGDLAAIRSADAVILPQGCSGSLYAMAKAGCPNVFPNFDVRFAFPGKTGQARLFGQTRVPHPRTEAYPNLAALHTCYGLCPQQTSLGFPLVFKLNHGGEGEHVYRLDGPAALAGALDIARRYEHSGQAGFVFQEYVPCGNRSLRVVVIGQTTRSYWRVQPTPGTWTANLAKGAHLDPHADPHLQQAAVEAVRRFCGLTAINLAGFDLIFSAASDSPTPLFLEINFFFGRKGLGGSESFYALLNSEILNWIKWLDRG